MRRVVAVSVGFTFERVFRAVARVGLGEGDVVLLFNSLPDAPPAREAMRRLVEEIGRIYEGAVVEERWLDPRRGFEDSVAEVRRRVEAYAPCRAYFLAVGGFRWLSLALTYAALAANTVGGFRGVEVASLELELEEDSRTRDALRAMFPTQEERVVRVPVLARLADLDYDDLRILELVSRGVRRARQIQRALGHSKSALQRRLERLVRKGLLEAERRGKGYLYKLTPLARMLV